MSFQTPPVTARLWSLLGDFHFQPTPFVQLQTRCGFHARLSWLSTQTTSLPLLWLSLLLSAVVILHSPWENIEILKNIFIFYVNIISIGSQVNSRRNIARLCYSWDYSCCMPDFLIYWLWGDPVNSISTEGNCLKCPDFWLETLENWRRGLVSLQTSH